MYFLSNNIYNYSQQNDREASSCQNKSSITLLSMHLLFHVNLQRFILSLVDFQCQPYILASGDERSTFTKHSSCLENANPLNKATMTTTNGALKPTFKCLKKSLERHGKNTSRVSAQCKLTFAKKPSPKSLTQTRPFQIWNLLRRIDTCTEVALHSSCKCLAAS